MTNSHIVLFICKRFPNPATHKAQMMFNAWAGDEVKIGLYNSMGQLIGNIQPPEAYGSESFRTAEVDFDALAWPRGSTW